MGSVINATISEFAICVAIHCQCEGINAKRLRLHSRDPPGIDNQQHNPTDEREGSDHWRNEVTFCGLNVDSKEVDRFSRGREGDA